MIPGSVSVIYLMGGAYENRQKRIGKTNYEEA